MAYSSEIELQESLKASGEGKQRLQRKQQLVSQAYIIQQYTFDKSACLPLNLKRHDNEDHNIVQRGDHKFNNKSTDFQFSEKLPAENDMITTNNLYVV